MSIETKTTTERDTNTADITVRGGFGFGGKRFETGTTGLKTTKPRRPSR